MTADESNARLTEFLTGRTVDCVTRQGKELTIHTTDGHLVVLQSDVNGDIYCKRVDARIILPDVFGKGLTGVL